MAKLLEKYIEGVCKVYSKPDAREETYYPTLKKLLEDCANKFKKEIDVTILPKKTEGGSPDFRIWDGELRITGYIEAKRPEETDLDKIEESEQLQRYISTFPNVILTNFLEFRIYRGHKSASYLKVSVARETILHKLGATPPVKNEKEFFKLIQYFLDFSLPRAFSAETLAEELSKRTGFLRKEVIEPEICGEEKSKLEGYYEAFEKYLVSGLSREDFADLFAQTITYGMFAAKIKAGDNGFNRTEVHKYIPATIGVLRDSFHLISLDEEISGEMRIIVEDIAHVLAVADVKGIVRQYLEKRDEKDPIIPFYEDFLARYDPENIVSSIHILLKEKFGLAEGLADRSVNVLDPASGTATFLAEAVRTAVAEHSRIHGDGGKARFIKEHILEHFFGFEL
jgi:hypothetical protein